MAYADRRPAGARAGMIAALFAGPIFVASYALAAGIAAAANTPTPLALEATGLGLLVAAIAMPVGTVIAIAPCVLAATLLSALAQASGIARLAPVWMLAGAAPIAPLAIYNEMEPTTSFALAATAALCALVARRTVLRQRAER